MAVVSVWGPAGIKSPYGSFANKPPFIPVRSGRFTVMGPMGAPMRPPYGSFSGKPQPPSQTTTGLYQILFRRRRR